MARLRSFITLLWMITYARAMPVADNDGDDDDEDGCWEPVMPTLAIVKVPDSPSAEILAPYEHPPPTPHTSPSQHPHTTLPVSRQSQTPVILGAAFGAMIVLVAISLAARYAIRRRRGGIDPFRDPPKPRLTAFRFRSRSVASKKRLSDESWVSPPLPDRGSPGPPLSHDLELRRCRSPRRKLVPVTTPVCTPTDTEFGSRLECGDPDPGIPVPPVQVPSPVYIPPFSPSPSPSLSSASLSPASSTEPLTSPSLDPARLSRLLSSTFGALDSPTRPMTAHLIHTARSHPQVYRPPSVISTSPSVRFAGTRSRTSFYPGPTVRDTFSTVTTTDADPMLSTVPHPLRTVTETNLFGDPGDSLAPSASAYASGVLPLGTWLALKVRMSDASEHARYRWRERERQRERERERAEQRLSAESAKSAVTSVEVVRREFKLRDSESVLREIGW